MKNSEMGGINKTDQNYFNEHRKIIQDELRGFRTETQVFLIFLSCLFWGKKNYEMMRNNYNTYSRNEKLQPSETKNFVTPVGPLAPMVENKMEEEKINFETQGFMIFKTFRL
jgi:hypothetical protein